MINHPKMDSNFWFEKAFLDFGITPELFALIPRLEDIDMEDSDKYARY